jgi:hypothetical protein
MVIGSRGALAFRCVWELVAMARESIGLRFTTEPNNEAEVERLYRDAGFNPLRKERQDDGCITFVFQKVDNNKLIELIASVPFHYSAIKGNVVGNAPPFSRYDE